MKANQIYLWHAIDYEMTKTHQRYGKPKKINHLNNKTIYDYKDIDEGYGKIEFMMTLKDHRIDSFEMKY